MPFQVGSIALHDDGQHIGSAKRDVVDGVAGLGPGGNVLAIGPDLELTRDGSENIEIVERTSGNIVFRWTRVGVNDFECRVNCGGVACIMQNDSMKNVASGIAGLDANILLPPALLPPCLEEYANHLGAVDNFTETAVTGNGTVNEDAANHGMELDTGITIVGSALFRSKQTWTLGTRPIVASFIYRGFVAGVGVSRAWRLGLRADLVATGASNGAVFRYNGTDWVSQVTLGGNSEADTQTVSEGDLLTIIATSARVIFLINGAVVADYSTYIPTGALEFGAGVVTGPIPADPAPEFEIDFMSIKRF